MAQVVVVHGIGQQWEGWEQLRQRLEPAVLDGVRLAVRRWAVPDPGLRLGDVALAFYGDAFVRPDTRDGGEPPWDEHDVEDGLEIELLEEWWRQAALLEPEAVPLPGEEERTRGLTGYVASRGLLWQRARRALEALAASRFFAGVSDRVLLGQLKQVRRYLDEAPVRRAAQDAVGEEMSGDTRVLVGHSLGSVVAYEAACTHPGWPVTDLVTLGSPLGLPIVFRRLGIPPTDGRGAWPAGVERWTNIADRGDVVALVDRLAPLFGPVTDHRIDNGTRMHDLARYLSAPTTGRAIATALNSPGTKGVR